MRKSLYLLILIALFFSGDFAEATQGACSFHGGVMCGAGPDWDGSAICNDGWKDSSVSYLDSLECKDYISCSSSEFSSLYQKYDIDRLDNQKKDIESQINLINTELLSKLVEVEGKQMTMNSIIGEKNRLINDANFRISLQQSQLSIITSQLISALNSVKRECEILGQSKIYALQQKALQLKSEQEQAQKEARDKELQQIKSTLCPINSTLKDDNRCYCNTGYEINAIKDACVLKQTCSEGYVLKGDTCITYTQDCTNVYGQNTYGQKGESKGNSLCYCASGYKWNDGKTSCILDGSVKVGSGNLENNTNNPVVVVKYVKPTVPTLRVRSVGSPTGKVLGSLKPSLKYEVIGEDKGWKQIKFGNDLTLKGWVMSKYVKDIK